MLLLLHYRCCCNNSMRYAAAAVGVVVCRILLVVSSALFICLVICCCLLVVPPPSFSPLPWKLFVENFFFRATTFCSLFFLLTKTPKFVFEFFDATFFFFFFFYISLLIYITFLLLSSSLFSCSYFNSYSKLTRFHKFPIASIFMSGWYCHRCPLYWL